MLRSRSACPLSVLLATVALSTAGLSTHVHEAAAGHHEEKAKAGAEAKGQAKAAKDDLAKLRNPSNAREKAPETFRVKLETTKGDVVLKVTREWSPNGADRFYNLVKLGYYQDIAFFRVIDGFMAQFGIHGEPSVNATWRKAGIKDDPVVESNTRGRITFAKSGRPNSRTVQLFINLVDNRNLDRMGFAPFGEIVEGMENVDKIFKVGEGAPRGPGPNQNLIQAQGNEYLREKFPQLDYLVKASIVE